MAPLERLGLSHDVDDAISWLALRDGGSAGAANGARVTAGWRVLH